MVFHSVYFSEAELDLQGSSLMPLFFLLSGFSLMVAYAPKLGVNDNVSIDLNLQQSNTFRTMKFHQNRFARVYPVYLICIFVALPYWFYGYGDTAGHNYDYIGLSLITSILPLCTLFIYLLGSPINGPGWTICSLAILWLMFPCFANDARKKNVNQLKMNLIVCYWVQLALVVLVFLALIIPLGFWPAFAAATMNPILRIPLFLMGVFAGELCVRYPSEDAPLPWNDGVLFLCPCCNGNNNISQTAVEDDQIKWSRTIIQQATFLLVITLAVFIIDTGVRMMGGGGVLGAVWLQAIVPYSQLEMIVALTRANKSNIVIKVLSNNLAKWFGKLSMCIYLIHYPVIIYVIWVVNNRSIVWPEVWDCKSEYEENTSSYDNCINKLHVFHEEKTLPLWGIPLVWAISLCLAVVLYYAIEEPFRRALRTN